MIKFMLLFILGFALVIFLLGGFTVLRLVQRVLDINRQFSGKNNRKGSQNSRQQTRNGNIYDSRNTADRSRKIIPKDEGEYVDYDEMK